VAFALLPVIDGPPLAETIVLGLLFVPNGIGVAMSSVVAVSVRHAVTRRHFSAA
jgi:hypothetical protein